MKVIGYLLIGMLCVQGLLFNDMFFESVRERPLLFSKQVKVDRTLTDTTEKCDAKTSSSKA